MLPADDSSIGSVTIRLGTMAGGAPYPACLSSIRPTLATTILEAPRTRTYISTVNIHLAPQRLLINLTEDGGRYSIMTPQPDDRAAHVVHFTAAVYSACTEMGNTG